MKVIKDVIVKRFVNCPKCNMHEFGLHNLDNNEHFKDKPYESTCPICATSFSFQLDQNQRADFPQIGQAGQAVLWKEIPLLDWRPHLVHLVSDHAENPIHLVLRAGRHASHKPSDNMYFYNEHTCPINWMKEVKFVAKSGEVDPHGAFRFVKAIDLKDALERIKSNENIGDDDKASFFIGETNDDVITELFPRVLDMTFTLEAHELIGLLSECLTSCDYAQDVVRDAWAYETLNERVAEEKDNIFTGHDRLTRCTDVKEGDYQTALTALIAKLGYWPVEYSDVKLPGGDLLVNEMLLIEAYNKSLEIDNDYSFKASGG